MNKILIKTIALFLIQLLLMGNAAIAAEEIFGSTAQQRYNLSPRVNIDSNTLNSVFLEGLPDAFKSQADISKKSKNWLQGLTEYAQRKKQENQGKGFFKQNIIYLLFKKRVDRIDNRNKPLKVKSKQKKKAQQALARLKIKMNEKKRILNQEKVEEYEQRLNELETLLNNITIQGDWDDFISGGTKFTKDIAKHGALVREIKSIKTKPGKVKSKKKRAPRKKNPRQEEPEDQDVDNLEKVNDDNQKTEVQDLPVTANVQDLQKPALSIIVSEDIHPEEDKDTSITLISGRKYILDTAVIKLTEAYNLVQEELPYEIAVEFERQINDLQKQIENMGRGQFTALKQKLRTVESNLEVAVETQKYKQGELAKKQAAEQAEALKNKKKDFTVNQPFSSKIKSVKKKTPFEQAVSLHDPENVRLRSASEVITELQGQRDLLDMMIESELENSMEVGYFNVRREIQGLVLQIGYSEASRHIEAGSDIFMEYKGEYYELRCAQILNLGSKLLLLPKNGKKAFFQDFPLDLNGSKFFYMPSTHSEDLQKSALEQILIKLAQDDETTGNQILDYFLRIKSAVSDIDSLEDLKENLPYTSGLDMFQKAAVNMIAKSKFGLVLGPFGTGKTRVIMAGAKNIILNKKKAVFVVAPQHKIADDITLQAGKSGIPVLRCGNNPNKFDPEVRAKYGRHSGSAQKEFIERYKKLNLSETDKGCLFVGTDLGASFDWLLKQLRDPQSAAYLEDVTLIVDEAALINYPELITAIYMLKPDALFLVGDHVQFSPYKLAAKFSRKVMNVFFEKISQKAMRRYHMSSFKELINMPFNKVKLSINYRNPWLSIDLLNNWYRGVIKLESYSAQQKDIPDEDTFVIEDTSTWDRQFPEEYYPGTHSYCNKTEALWILKRIKYFLDMGYSANDIATITLYNGQIRLINDFIDADGDISVEDAQVLRQNIFTPIRFQGAEKKVILASLVRSQKPSEFMETYNNGNRINSLFISEPEYAKAEALLVLLSRHKAKISVIGNHETLERLTEDKYKHMSYLYYSLFSYREKIDAIIDAQKVELLKKIEKENLAYELTQSSI